MTRSLCVVASALALGLVASPVVAYTTFAINGGPGDIQNAIVCKNGTYIKGFRGRTGDWIDRLTVICTKDPLGPGGRVGGSKSVGSFGGDGGGEVGPVLCQDSLVGKLHETMTADNRMVARVTFTCRSPATGQDIGVQRLGGAAASDTYDEQNCPPGEVATGVAAHWGKDVNAVSLICNTIVIQQ